MQSKVEISRGEWSFVLVIVLVVAILALTPFFRAATAAPRGMVFSGALLNAQDTNSYFAKMRQGYAGSWLFRLPYSVEEQEGIVFFTLYLALGHLARMTGLNLVFLFHAARIVSGGVLVVTLYRFLADFTTDVRIRRWAFLVAVFGSGLGFYALLSGLDSSVDLTIPEANNFFSILANTHFPLASAAAIWGILIVFGAERESVWRWIALSAIGLIIVQLSMLLVPGLWAALGAGVLWHWRAKRSRASGEIIRRALGLMAVTGAGVLLYFLAARNDAVLTAWTVQNVTPSPPVWAYLLGFGLLLPLAGFSLWEKRQSDSPLPWVLAGWLFGVAMLLYFPHPLQRRFVGGVGVPLGILAGLGFARIILQTNGMRRLAALLLLMLFILPTNLLLVGVLSLAPERGDEFVYLTRGELQSLHWLGTNVSASDVVLASTELGNFIPAYAAARVVYGHPFETIDAPTREPLVNSFFAGQLSSAEAEALLTDFGVTYIFNGPRERVTDVDAWLPPSAVPVYSADGTTIYMLTPG